MEQFLSVHTIVADLRREPVDATGRYVHDDLQETQLLYNETLLVTGVERDWFKVEAVEQPKYVDKNRWQGYSGWVRKDVVTHLRKPRGHDAFVKNPSAPVLRGPGNAFEMITEVLIGTGFPIDRREGDFCKVLLPGNDCGWVYTGDLSIVENARKYEYIRQRIIDCARLFIGVPYYWGGRSMKCGESGFHDREARDVIRGVDCSGLVSLIHRVNGIEVPRDTHDQWLKARAVTTEKLRPADLIFLSAEGSDRVNHVIIIASAEECIEALETGSRVLVRSFQDRFGLSLEKLTRKGSVLDGKRIHFGTYCKE